MSHVSLDTGAIIEYIDLTGPFHRQAAAIIESILAGKLVAMIPHPILAETFYVSARIYQKLKLEEPKRRAEELITWLYSSPNFDLAQPSLELALLAGSIKRTFRLALTDAYVVAASKLHEGKAVFRKREREMAKKLGQLTKRYDLLFLEDYSLQP